MTIRKLVNFYVFDFPICFPVPIMGLETFDGIVYCFIHIFSSFICILQFRKIGSYSKL